MVARESATALLIVPGDLPLVTPAALERLLEAADAALAAGSGRSLVAIAPADARTGTNALLLSPVDVIDPCFGPSSFEAHARAAALAEASVQVVVDPELGFDLDTPEDLGRLEHALLEQLIRFGAEAIAEMPAA
jgi:2-phospho-L-lactate guanylyltransferase